MLRLAASLLLVALVAAELGEAETQQGQPPDEKLVKPIMVKRLPTAGEAAAISTGLLPVEKSPFAADEASLAEVRKRQQSQLKSIQKQLVEGYKQRDNLLLTQKLMTVSLQIGHGAWWSCPTSAPLSRRSSASTRQSACLQALKAS